MTEEEIKTELEHHIVHSRNLGRMPTTEKQLLSNILANQVLIMEATLRVIKPPLMVIDTPYVLEYCNCDTSSFKEIRGDVGSCENCGGLILLA